MDYLYCFLLYKTSSNTPLRNPFSNFYFVFKKLTSEFIMSFNIDPEKVLPLVSFHFDHIIKVILLCHKLYVSLQIDQY
jgi:hypothetical protein